MRILINSGGTRVPIARTDRERHVREPNRLETENHNT